ncbi:hypothetical protein [Microbacterium sp. 22296]|uniref:hypothetical protein n=1 Tax=Microbacterium sp. 22296 TaxID=3453903 RepID=UPI003F868245
MSSDNFLRTVRAHLKDAIKPNLPTRWRIFPTLTAPTKLAVPAVYFEFIEISNEMAGKALAVGNVAANFELAVIIPETATAKAEDNADAAVLDLIRALDNSDSLFWGPSATKVRLDSGQLGWRIPVSVLTSTHPEPTN